MLSYQRSYFISTLTEKLKHWYSPAAKQEFYPNIDESKVREWETNHNKPGEMNYDPSSDHNNYETYEQISAGYLMMKLNLFIKQNLIK